MKIRLNSGRFIPQIGFGTYQLQGQQCANATFAALNTGYRHIDSASIYRNGRDIQKCIVKSGLSRQELYITSKIAPNEQGYETTKAACTKIIQELQCGYLDLLLIHWPGVSKVQPNSQLNAKGRLQTWKALRELKAEGKVIDIGVSNFLKLHLEHLLNNSPEKPAVNQFQIHPLLWEGDTIDFCRKNQIAIQAYSPLARSDKQLLDNPLLLSIAQKKKKSVAQICLRWSLQHQFIVLPKSGKPERIEQNFHIWDFELTAEEMEMINGLKTVNVRTCWDPNSILH